MAQKTKELQDFQSSQDLLDVEKIIARDSQGLLDLYDRRAPEMLGFLVHFIGDHAQAEELLVEIFDTVWRRPESFSRPRMKPFTWLLTLARERVRNHDARQGQIADVLHQQAVGSPVGIGAAQPAEELPRRASASSSSG